MVSLALSFLALASPIRSIAEKSAPEVSGEAGILISSDGTCLWEKNADEKRLIASTTKLMTALVSLENAGLEEKVSVTEGMCLVEGSSMYLRAGEQYTVRELLLGLLLASGNDAALALAIHIAGSEEAFVRLMNQRAEELGLKNTHFENPHGLDAQTHYSSARDLAMLMVKCMDVPAFRRLVGTLSAEIKGLTFLNHNRLLTLCPGCLGGKTGYTRAAGRCLVSCCERDGLLLVCVTLSAPDDWNDHLRLYDWAYDTFQLRILSEDISFEVPVISGTRTQVHAVPPAGCRILLPRRENVEARAELPRFVFAPISAGEYAGRLRLTFGGEELAELPLVFAQSAACAYPCFKLSKELIP